jgi:NDP-sugar pyrophosphorylase family protein
MNTNKNSLSSLDQDISRNYEIANDIFRRTMVYINAGGKGSRLDPIAGELKIPKNEEGDNTKALLKAGRDSLIDHHVNLFLNMFEFGQVIVGAGSHYNVKTHLDKNHDQKLNVVNTEHQKGTAGDLIKAVRSLGNIDKNILVENVDTFIYVDDLRGILEQHEQSGVKATIVLTTQKGVPHEGAFYVDEDSKVVYSEEANEKYHLPKPENWDGLRASSTGVVIINSEYLRDFDWEPRDGGLSLYEDVLPELIATGDLKAAIVLTKHLDIGTPENLDKFLRHQDWYLGALGKRYKEQVDKE